MCIICVKPVGVLMPSHETLKTCWQGNPDGAGIAFARPEEGVVHINKGFMKLKAFKAHLDGLELGKDDLAVMHFRWATHGLKDSGNCHPFPLSSKIEALRVCNGTFPTAIAHNGVFGSMPAHNTLSDTQKFIAKVLCNPAIVNNIDNPAVKELIAGYCGSSSKLAILKPDRLSLIGAFETDAVTGLMYSNDGYKPNKWGYENHIACGVDDKDMIDEGEYITIPKCCELCNADNDIAYCEDYQLYLCDKCFDENWAIDNGGYARKD